MTFFQLFLLVLLVSGIALVVDWAKNKQSFKVDIPKLILSIACGATVAIFIRTSVVEALSVMAITFVVNKFYGDKIGNK